MENHPSDWRKCACGPCAPGSSLRLGQGDRPTAKNHLPCRWLCGPVIWSPQVPDGLRDEWTSPSRLYPAEAQITPLFPKELPMRPEAHVGSQGTLPVTGRLQRHPALCLCYPLGESSGDSHAQGIPLENTALTSVCHPGGRRPGPPTRAGSAARASLCPTPRPTQRWAMLRKSTGSGTFRMTDCRGAGEVPGGSSDPHCPQSSSPLETCSGQRPARQEAAGPGQRKPDLCH